MRVIAKRTLVEFYRIYPDSRGPLEAWYQEASKAIWQKPQDVKDKYKTASIVGNNRIVFNIGGNKYRLIVKIEYKIGIVYIRFVGTHKGYDKIKVGEV
ncbi:MAG: type II toxin-antitoxin system HigB family toxin [Leptospirales bacterium]